jgi:membrane protein DedA with SNARE-associated domain
VLTSILGWIARYTYFVLFPIAVIEGPIITIIGGFLSSSHQLNGYIAYAVLVAGDVTGDLLYYAIGYWGREKFIKRWGKYLGIKMENVEAMEKKLKQHQVKTLLLGKTLQGVGGVALVAAGSAKISIAKFTWYEFLGTLPKSLILFMIGFYFGSQYEKLSHYLDYVTYATIAIAVLGIAAYFIFRKKTANGGR